MQSHPCKTPSGAARRFPALLLALWLAAAPAVGEELVLKNGQKIQGTIVGFENNMFRVETEYGFALVRKDSVEKVNFTAGAKSESTRKTKPSPEPAPEKAARTSPAAAARDVAAAPAPEPAKPAAVPEPAKPAPPSRPVDEPLPASLEEHVDGTTYINDSFHFAMFKPPGWKIFAEVPKETGSAIMAVGTEDEQTLLFVDRQVWSGSPDLKSDSAEAKLRNTYQEYQKLMESPIELNGQPAVRRVFKGVIDGVEWHGVSVHLARNNAVFGIIGLTSAETFQFQQALFNKIISSFHFLIPAAPAASAAAATARP